MARPVIVGLDAGTTSAKFVAVDQAGTIVASAGSDQITTSTPEVGASEQNADEIFAALTVACRRGVESLGSLGPVAALAIASQSGSVVPVTRGGTQPVVTWMDTRSRPTVDGWDAPTRRMIREQSGWSAATGLGLSTIASLRARAVDEPVVRWASVDDYIVERLTGSWTTNPSNAAGMQLIDVASHRWSPMLCGLADIDPSTLSPLAESGVAVGNLTAGAAEATHLPEGMPVVIGGHDQACAALGLGAVEPGNALLSVGTAWVLTVVTERVEVSDVASGFNLSPHVVVDRWSVSRNLGGLGAILASAIGDITGSEVGVDAELEAALADHEPRIDDVFFVPNLADIASGGSFTDGGVSPVQRFSAVVEACAFEVRRALEAAGDVAPTSGELVVVGGGTRSVHITQTLSDVVGQAVHVRPNASWPALGAARLAAIASGWDIDPGARLTSARVEPRAEYTEVFERRYGQYHHMVQEGQS